MSESTYESALSRRRLLQGAGVAVASVGASPWLLETASAVAAESDGRRHRSTTCRGRATTVPESSSPWLKAHGVTFKPTYIANHDDIQAKILALHGGKGYDIITYYQGYKAAVRRAQDPHADRREEDPEPQGHAAVLPQQLPRLLGQERRAHRGADVLGRARPRLRLEGHAHGAELVRDPLHEEAQGRGHRRRRPGRRLHPGRAHARDQRRDHDPCPVRRRSRPTSRSSSSSRRAWRRATATAPSASPTATR